MKIMVYNPVTFLGRAVIRELALRGHKAYGLVSSDEDALMVKSDGGTAVNGDLIHGGEWCNTAQKVDSIIMLNEPFDDVDITKVSSDNEISLIGMKHLEKVTNLMKAAADGKAKNVVLLHSYQCYGDRKGKWASDDDTILEPAGFCKPLKGLYDGILKTREDTGIPLVQAFSSFIYGNGDWFSEIATDLKDGKAKFVGSGENYWNVIHVEDAAAMLANAAEKIDHDVEFFIADDRPVTQRDFMDHMADVMGVIRPTSMSEDECDKKYGKLVTELLTLNTRVPGLRAMELLGYHLKYRSYEKGIEATLKEIGVTAKDTNISKAA